MSRDKARYAAWYAINSEHKKAMEAERYALNSARVIVRTAEWKREHPEKQAAYQAKWKKDNKGKLTAAVNKRRAAKVQRTPSWADADALLFWYECRPAECHVDHKIPLQGKTVSGLHVENNLQWLPARNNLRKGNKLYEHP